MHNISKVTKSVEDIDELRYFFLGESDYCMQIVDLICLKYDIERRDISNSDLYFMWNKATDEYYYCVYVAECDSWGVELDTLTFIVNEVDIPSEDVDYIHSYC